MAAVQMNIRIDPRLKREGDETFARLGYTPTQAVRLLWQYVAEHDRLPEFMLEAEEALREAEQQQKLKLIHRAAGSVARFRQEVGLKSIHPDDMSLSKLREDFLEDRLAEYENLDG